MFIVYYPVKIEYICVFMTCSTSYCLCDTLVDPWYVCIYVHMYVFTCVRACAHVYVCIYVCMYVCMYVCTYVCT